jgi:hypothetical protein
MAVSKIAGPYGKPCCSNVAFTGLRTGVLTPVELNNYGVAIKP